MVRLPAKWLKWGKRILLIAGLGLIIAGLLLSFVFNVVLAPCTKEQFTIKNAPEFPIFGEQFDIDCNLYQPDPEFDFYAGSRPAVVLVHGFMSSKAYYQGLAFELCKRGFVCLAITANGFAASGGGFTPTWENVTLSAVKFLRDYNASLQIDTNRIGLFGHSMGSFSATVASIMDQELGNYWVNATVGMGGPFLNITRGFGSGFAFLLGNPVMYPTVWYNASDAIQNAIIEGRTDVLRPYNYLNIIGSKDQAFSQNSAYELVYGMSTPAFWAAQGVASQADIQTYTTYGEFNGSARRLVVIPGIGHLFEGQHSTTVNQTVYWFEQAMKLTDEGAYPGALDPNTILVELTSLTGGLAMIGGFILIIPAIAYLGNWLKPEMIVPKKAMEMEKRDKIKMFLIYGVVFVGISFAVSPIIMGLDLLHLIPTDFLGSNLIALPLLVQGLLMIPAVIILMWYEKRKFGLELSDFGISKDIKPYLQAALYGVLLFAILYVTANVGLTATMHSILSWRVVGFLELFLYIFVGMMVFEVLFRGLIQNKVYQFRDDSGLIPTRWKEIVKAALITGVIEGLALGVITTMLLAAGGFNVFSGDMSGMMPQDLGISIGWLPPMFILLPLVFVVVEVIFAVLKAGLYRESNRNFMASAIFTALALAWLISAILPAINPYAPRFVFMT